MMLTSDLAADLAALAACWRSIGLRRASVEWWLDRPAVLTGSLAMRLRSALGPALASAGARSATLGAIPGHGRPPALWFRGWDGPRAPARIVGADLYCVGAVEAEWPALRTALGRIRLPGERGSLVSTLGCRVRWNGRADDEEAFGPALPPGIMAHGDACLVEALSPLHLTAGGRMVTGPPPFDVLVRSAGERLRQLCRHWAEGADTLPPVVGRAVREARYARLAWTRPAASVAIVRQSSSTGREQVVRGMRGAFAYEDAGPLAVAVLALGAEVGIGKDTAMGCGTVRVSVAEVA